MTDISPPLNEAAGIPKQIASSIDRAQSAYGRIAAAAETALPFLTPDRTARVRL